MTQLSDNYLRNLSPLSQFHWISHLVTEGVSLTARYEYNDGKLPNEKPITEKIVFTIHLNVRNMNQMNPGKPCKGWKSSRVNEKDIKIEITEDETCTSVCNFTCFWMKEKNRYLYQELHALRKYIETVNNSMFSTIFSVEIICDDLLPLDKDFEDAVQQHLDDEILKSERENVTKKSQNHGADDDVQGAPLSDLNAGSSSVSSENQKNLSNHKIGRNDLCFCGSGKKYKYCCMERLESVEKDLTQVY